MYQKRASGPHSGHGNIQLRGRCSWLYVLCNQPTHTKDSYIYVGMTVRLVTRIKEHRSKRGSSMIREHGGRWYVLGVYKYSKKEEHQHNFEEWMTHSMMKIKGDLWYNVYGAKHCSTKKERVRPNTIDTMNMPRMCYCNLPTETGRRRGDGRVYHHCVRSRMIWLENIIDDVSCKNCNYFEWN
jgi:predicted GIY-YIG superfamily endonuclease